MTKCYNFLNLCHRTLTLIIKKDVSKTNFKKSLQRRDLNLQNDDRSSLKMFSHAFEFLQLSGKRKSILLLATRCKIIFREKKKNKVTIVKTEAWRFKTIPSESFAKAATALKCQQFFFAIVTERVMLFLQNCKVY